MPPLSEVSTVLQASTLYRANSAAAAYFASIATHFAANHLWGTYPMEENLEQRAEHYLGLRTQNPAWLVLASRRAPVFLASLRLLFEPGQDGIEMSDALRSIADTLANCSDPEIYQVPRGAELQEANRELREWINRRLIVERNGRIYATDFLECAFRFTESLEDRVMTSTASRLSVVQREIENLETHLNSDPKSRMLALKRRIKELQAELEKAKAGLIPVFDDEQAIEAIREVYGLAIGLLADFRRMEDSWRDADRELRHSIISEKFHRGEIVDNLLDGQEALLNTPEGRVFDSFLQQLWTDELKKMRLRLQNIMRHPAAPKALNKSQQFELLRLVPRLIQETALVLQARARSERDVKSFMKTGLVVEHHRVGHLLNEIFSVVVKLDWNRKAIRLLEVPLPPIGMALYKVPVVERLRFRGITGEAAPVFDLSRRRVSLEQMEEEFWLSFDGLDRDAFIKETLRILAEQGRPLSLPELASFLPPTHDLECFTIWITMAREAGIDVYDAQTAPFDLTDADDRRWRFHLPFTQLESEKLRDIKWEL